jgi:hypothetical protein
VYAWFCFSQLYRSQIAPQNDPEVDTIATM